MKINELIKPLQIYFPELIDKNGVIDTWQTWEEDVYGNTVSALVDVAKKENNLNNLFKLACKGNADASTVFFSFWVYIKKRINPKDVPIEVVKSADLNKINKYLEEVGLNALDPKLCEETEDETPISEFEIIIGRIVNISSNKDISNWCSRYSNDQALLRALSLEAASNISKESLDGSNNHDKYILYLLDYATSETPMKLKTYDDFIGNKAAEALPCDDEKPKQLKPKPTSLKDLKELFVPGEKFNITVNGVTQSITVNKIAGIILITEDGNKILLSKITKAEKIIEKKEYTLLLTFFGTSGKYHSKAEMVVGTPLISDSLENIKLAVHTGKFPLLKKGDEYIIYVSSSDNQSLPQLIL